MLLHTYFLNVFLIAHFSSRNHRCEWGNEWGSQPQCQKECRSFLLSGVLLAQPSTLTHPPNFQISLYVIRKAFASAKYGQGLNGHSVHVGKLITPHPTAQGLGSTLHFQCPRLPHPTAFWRKLSLWARNLKLNQWRAWQITHYAHQTLKLSSVLQDRQGWSRSLLILDKAEQASKNKSSAL